MDSILLLLYSRSLSFIHHTLIIIIIIIMRDTLFESEFEKFLSNDNGKRRQYCVIQGEYMRMMLSDTTRIDPMDIENKTDHPIRVIDIVQMEIEDETMRHKGIFASCLERMLEMMRIKSNWQYLRVESILNDHVLEWLKKRKDVVWKEWSAPGDIWIGIHLKEPFVMTLQQWIESKQILATLL